MRCGAPLLGQRVAPRCTAADGLMVVTVTGGRVISRDIVPLEISGVLDLVDAVARHRIDTLVCGGIDRDTRDSVLAVASEVLDNVACTASEIVAALDNGTLKSGFRLAAESELPVDRAARGNGNGGPDLDTIDCLLCRNKVCLNGDSCLAAPAGAALGADPIVRRMIETAFDIAQEEERKLCRVAEMVYFCLEMDYRRIGVAFCTELLEPARILTSVLRRFFEVAPICCKVGGVGLDDFSSSGPLESRRRSAEAAVCNPLAQAEILNHRQTDFNLSVGLCVGADSIFARASQAPVSTLFVKDRSLANNPIGALYSDYYLRESVSPAGRVEAPDHTFNNSVLIKEES